MKGFLLVLALVLLLTPFIVRAQECQEDCGSLADSPNSYYLCCVIVRIAIWLYIIGGALAVVVIIIGGITYITSGGNEDRIGKAKKIIVNGLIGAAIIALSGVIVDTVKGMIENYLTGG